MQRKLIEGIQNALELGPSSTKLMETVLNIAQAIQQHDVGTVQSLISSLTEAVAQGTFLPHKAKALINKDEALFLSIQKKLGPLLSYFTTPQGLEITFAGIQNVHEELQQLKIVGEKQKKLLQETYLHTQQTLQRYPLYQEARYILPTVGLPVKTKKLIQDELQKRVAFEELSFTTNGARGKTIYAITITAPDKKNEIINELTKIVTLAIREETTLQGTVDQIIAGWEKIPPAEKTILQDPQLAIESLPEALTYAQEKAIKAEEIQNNSNTKLLLALYPEQELDTSYFLQKTYYEPVQQYFDNLEEQARALPAGEEFIAKLPELKKAIAPRRTKETLKTPKSQAEKPASTISSTTGLTDIMQVMQSLRTILGRDIYNDNTDEKVIELIGKAGSMIATAAPTLTPEEYTALLAHIKTFQGQTRFDGRDSTPIRFIFSIMTDPKNELYKEALKQVQLMSKAQQPKDNPTHKVLGFLKEAYDTYIERRPVRLGIKNKKGGNTTDTKKENSMQTNIKASPDKGNKKNDPKKVILAAIGALLLGGLSFLGGVNSFRPAFEKEVQDTFDNARDAITAALDLDTEKMQQEIAAAMDKALPQLPESLDKQLEEQAQVIKDAQQAMTDTLATLIANRNKPETERLPENDILKEGLASITDADLRQKAEQTTRDAYEKTPARNESAALQTAKDAISAIVTEARNNTSITEADALRQITTIYNEAVDTDGDGPADNGPLQLPASIAELDQHRATEEENLKMLLKERSDAILQAEVQAAEARRVAEASATAELTSLRSEIQSYLDAIKPYATTYANRRISATDLAIIKQSIVSYIGLLESVKSTRNAASLRAVISGSHTELATTLAPFKNILDRDFNYSAASVLDLLQRTVR